MERDMYRCRSRYSRVYVYICTHVERQRHRATERLRRSRAPQVDLQRPCPQVGPSVPPAARALARTLSLSLSLSLCGASSTASGSLPVPPGSLMPAAKTLIPTPQFLPPGHSFSVFQCFLPPGFWFPVFSCVAQALFSCVFSVFSSTLGKPEAGSGDNFWRSYVAHPEEVYF